MSTRIITLTGRAPVEINEQHWPIIASVSGWVRAFPDPARQAQAEMQNQTPRYDLFVRRHIDDGRIIVSGRWSDYEVDVRHGQLLKDVDVAMQDTADVIRGIAEQCGIPEEFAHECIADLPPEVL